MKLHPRHCRHCGAQFFSGSNFAKYCSDLCNIFAHVKVAPSGCFECLLIGPEGYPTIISRETGKTARVHRIICAEAFGEIPPGMEGCHTCDNPPCVRPDHLFVGTKYENKLDSIAKGRHAFGTRMGNNILSEGEVLAVRADPRRPVEIAKEYGISPVTVSSIKRKRSWKWLPGPEPVIRPSPFATARPRF